MKNKHKPIIIVHHKKKSHHHAPHGSWKIAYADFMTAMMALFLVLALVSSSTPSQLQNVADYFRMPLSTSLQSGNRFSNSDSILPGGGENITRVDGEEQKGELTEAQEIEYERKQNEILSDVGKKVADVIQLDPDLKKFASNLIIELTTQGLRIQILSDNKKPMFAIGSAKITPPMKAILHAIAPILNTLPNKITLSGHTDERKYPTGDKGYSNWELSSDRASASRRELVAGGLDAAKVIRIIALADTIGLNQDNIGPDSNRRISILVLNQKASQELSKPESLVTGLDLINKTKSTKSSSETHFKHDPLPFSPTEVLDTRSTIIGLPNHE